MKVKVLATQRCPTLSNPWTIAHQVPLSVKFFRQECWSWFPLPSQGIFLTQGLNPCLLHCRQIFYHLSHQGSPIVKIFIFQCLLSVILIPSHLYRTCCNVLVLVFFFWQFPLCFLHFFPPRRLGGCWSLYINSNLPFFQLKFYCTFFDIIFQTIYYFKSQLLKLSLPRDFFCFLFIKFSSYFMDEWALLISPSV